MSQTTIIRAFKLEVEPSVSLLQRIVATLKYEFIQPPIPPANATNEEYIQHLKDVIEFERKDKKIRLDQKEAEKNRDVHEERREKAGGVLPQSFSCLLLSPCSFTTSHIWTGAGSRNI